MPHVRIRDNDRFEPDWVKTDAQRTRWRRCFVTGLLGHLGFSSRWIADAMRSSDTHVRNILKSETLAGLDYDKLLTQAK